MAKIFLDPADSITVSNNNVSVFGSTGTESITVAAGVTGTIFDQNTEKVLLSGTAASFKYQQAGNQIKVYNSDGTTLVATIPVQGDSDGTALTFTDGTAQAKLTSGVMTFGGATVGSTAASVTPTTFDTTVKTPSASATVSVAAGAASATEGGNATFTVTLSAAQTTATTVNFAVAGTGGATVGTDTGSVTATGATLSGSTLTFPAGVVSATVTVPVTFDTTAETGEGITLTLSSPSTGVSLGTATASTTLADPAAPTFTLTSNAVAGAANEEGTSITYTITPSGVTDKAYTFTLSTSGDTVGGVASAGSASDFSPASQTVTFAAGTSTAQTVVQTIVNDGSTEGLEGYKTSLLDSNFAVVSSKTGLITDPSAATGSGTNFVLTTSSDNIVGTTGNDTVTGVRAATAVAATDTLSAGDVIDGGAGVDTFTVTSSAANTDATGGAIFKNIETVNLRQTAAAGTALTLAAGSVPGATTVNSYLSIGDVVVTGLAAGATIGVVGNGSIQTGLTKFAYATATTPILLAISGGTDNTATADITATASAGVTTATITSSGAANKVDTIKLDSAGANTITSLTVDAATNLTATLTAADYSATSALVVKGAAASVDLGTAANFKTIDASGLTAGGLTVATGTNTTSFKGGVGNDVVTTAAVATTTASTIDAGTGSADILVVGATANVDTAAEAKVYSGFDTLRVGTGVVADASLFTTSTITAIQTSGAATINNMTATQAAAITVTDDSTTTGTITGATTVGQLDTVKATFAYTTAALEAADADTTLTWTTPSFTGVETFNLTANLNAATTDFKITAVTSLAAFTNITVGGTAKTWNVTTGDATFNVNSTIDLSTVTTAATIDASGATTAPGNGLSIKGGSAADTLKGTKLTDVISGGAGADTITPGLQGTGQANIVTGGAGADLYVASAGQNTTFKFSGTDSISTAGQTAGYLSTAMDTIGSGTTVVAATTWADGTAGFKATIDTDVSATALTFSTTAPTFGTTTVTNAGDFYVYDTAAGGVLYVYQDSNSNGKIDAAEFAVQIVGATSAFTAGEFAVTSGDLVYTSIT